MAWGKKDVGFRIMDRMYVGIVSGSDLGTDSVWWIVLRVLCQHIGMEDWGLNQVNNVPVKPLFGGAAVRGLLGRSRRWRAAHVSLAKVSNEHRKRVCLHKVCVMHLEWITTWKIWYTHVWLLISQIVFVLAFTRHVHRERTTDSWYLDCFSWLVDGFGC